MRTRGPNVQKRGRPAFRIGGEKFPYNLYGLTDACIAQWYRDVERIRAAHTVRTLTDHGPG
jgi:hypothetical protein